VKGDRLSRWLKTRLRVALARLLRAQSHQVFDGPFRGMLLPDTPYDTMTVRFLLGTHEMELHPVIERLVAREFRTIVNIGAALGYYAVGLALRCRDSDVIAFETLESWHPIIAAAAQANGVGERVTILGDCNVDALRQCLATAQSPVLVFVDIEGNEMPLFDGEMATRLSHATVLIETHDHRIPGATDELLRRFAATHRAEAYAPRSRTRGDLPPTVSSGAWRVLSWPLVWLMKEMRAGPQQWLLFTPLIGP
jgi:hypothetical protein